MSATDLHPLPTPTPTPRPMPRGGEAGARRTLWLVLGAMAV
jgi:hypothetical protein